MTIIFNFIILSLVTRSCKCQNAFNIFFFKKYFIKIDGQQINLVEQSKKIFSDEFRDFCIKKFDNDNATLTDITVRKK
jgi:hypothetical protein